MRAGNISIGNVSSHQHFHGEGHARSRYRAEIDELLSRYHASFVGRLDELAKLRAFAVTRSPGYLLVEAAGGMGKSALMAESLLQVELAGETPAIDVVAFFVRDPGARYPGEFLVAVNGQLLTLLGRVGGTPHDLLALRTQFSELWTQAQERAGAAHPLLLLVDGVDEQANDEPTIVQLLPESLREWVHVIVSSRPRPNVREQIDLSHPLRRAPSVQLGPLSQADVRAMLVATGQDSAAAATLSARVHTLAQGEALLSRFLCEDVAARGATILDALDRQPPLGIHDYFLREVKKIDTAAADATWQVCSLIAAALGPLSIDELTDILQTSTRALRHALSPIERYLLGRERLQLFHRSLYAAMLEDLGPSEARAWRTRLLAWCAQRLTTAGESVPRYALDHFARHLAEEGRTDELVALISRRWLDAHRRMLGNLTRFAQDVELAYQRSADAARRSETAHALTDAIAMAVVLGSLGTVAQNLPPRAVWLLARLDRIDEAAAQAELVADPAARVTTLAALAQALAEQAAESQATAVLERALRLALENYTFEMQAAVAALVKVADALPGVTATEALVEALTSRATLFANDVEQVAAAGANLARHGQKAGVDRVCTWLGTILDYMDTVRLHSTGGRIQTSASGGDAATDPQSDDEESEERESDFYDFVDRATTTCMQFAACTGEGQLAERAEQLVSSLEHDQKSSQLLARAAQSRAARGNTLGAMALAQAAARWPFEPSRFEAIVPSLFQLSQLALCASELTADCFFELRGELLQQMNTLVDSLPAEHKMSGLARLADAYGATGRLDDLRQLLTISQPPAAGYGAPGDREDYSRRSLHAQIALALLACGDIAGAVRTMDNLPPSVSQDRERRALLDSLLACGRVEMARRVLTKIDYPSHRILATAEIAADAGRRNDRERASILLAEVISACTVFDDEGSRISLYAEAGRSLARLGRTIDARRCADLALELDLRCCARRSLTAATALELLLIELGDSAGFLSYFARHSGVWNMRDVLRCAHALVARGDTKSLAMHFDSLPHQPEPLNRVSHYAQRAQVLRLLGRREQADAQFLAAHAATISGNSTDGTVSAALASFMSAVGNTEAAAAEIESGAVRASKCLNDTESLAALAKASAALGDKKRAAELSRQSISTINFKSVYIAVEGNLGKALSLLPESEVSSTVNALLGRAHAGGHEGYVRRTATEAIWALQGHGLDSAAIALLLDTLPLFRGERRAELFSAIEKWAPLLARHDPEGLLHLCQWVEEVTGWWEADTEVRSANKVPAHHGT